MVHVFMFQNLLFACALTSTLGLASIKEDIKPSYKSDEVSFHFDNKKMVSYNDNDYEITLNNNEMSYRYSNLSNYLNQVSSDAVFSSWYVVTSDSITLNFDEFLVDDSISFASQGNGYITLNLDSDVDSFGLWTFSTQQENVDYYMFVLDDESIYSDVKSAIELDIQANNPSDNMPQVLDDFVGVLTTAIGSLASGIAGGVTAMAQDLFLQDDGEGNVTGLSVFGGIVALFAGLALAVAITTKVYTWVTSLGN